MSSKSKKSQGQLVVAGQKKASPKAAPPAGVQKVGGPKKDPHEAPIKADDKKAKKDKVVNVPESAKKVLDLFKTVVTALLEEPLREQNSKGFDLALRSAGQFEKRVASAYRKATRVANKGDKLAKKRARLAKVRATLAALEKELEEAAKS